MKYEIAYDLQKEAEKIIDRLGFSYIKKDSIICIRSYGSSSRAIARCHGMGKIMQLALNRKAFYVLEFISEKFDKMPEKEKTKVIIHELMHIPKNFGGGFKHHDYVTEKEVDNMHERYKNTQTDLKW